MPVENAIVEVRTRAPYSGWASCLPGHLSLARAAADSVSETILNRGRRHPVSTVSQCRIFLYGIFRSKVERVESEDMSTFHTHNAHDRCHLCGFRREHLVDVRYSAPLEYSPPRTPFLRVCAVCADTMARVAREDTPTVIDTATSPWDMQPTTCLTHEVSRLVDMPSSAETVLYQGIRLRSHLAARWAVFFETLGCAWHYETRGFVRTDGTFYLPDFYIVDWGHWLTISRQPLASLDLALGTGFCRAVGPLLLVAGDPVPERHDIWGWQDIDGHLELLQYDQADWARCRDCGGGWWIRAACGTYVLEPCGNTTCRAERWPIRTAEVQQAYGRALQTRFARGIASA